MIFYQRHKLGFSWYFIILWSLSVPLSAQHVPVHTDNAAIYHFMDELAGIGVIELNSAIKPYSRKEIADWLATASASDALNKRQQKEVDFYLRDYAKELTGHKTDNKRFDLFYYRDSLFQITVNPVLGGEWMRRDGNNAFYRWNGGTLHGTIGKHFGFYGSLRDNYESDIKGGRQYLVNRRGAVYKNDGKTEQEYSEARGGLTWSWDWGNVGLHKNHYTWGNGYNGANIFSGNTPSHAYLSLNVSPVSWFELNYMHGWLVSEVVDTARSFPYYDGTREVFADKYVAASMFTVRPMPRMNVSFGNSIVYADTRVNPVYFVPFLFYKSVDHTYNGASNDVGQNSQMFLDVSSRQIEHLHLYTSLFVDEISFTRMLDKEQHSNYVSLKSGARLTNVPEDFMFTLEYTRNNPMVYRHIIPTTTWESNGYTMGHYLKDNSDEWYFNVAWKPVRGVKLDVSYNIARKGTDYQTILESEDPFGYAEINTDEPRWGLPFMNEVRWKSQTARIDGSWQIINDGYVYLSLEYKETEGENIEKYTPPISMNDGFMWKFGMNYGF